MDWWLSPELYLRRPPALNARYRLDNMLKAAAERGVQVRIIVYKEVPQALTLNSAHTKDALEALHPNIRVFRHPNHVVTASTFTSEMNTHVQSALAIGKMPTEVLKAFFGTALDGKDTVLFWAHHEKLCVVDKRIAFMGGLDACFGRWDTHTHPIADASPAQPDGIIYPGQDYNNARVFDFEGVDKWEHNKLDRNVYSRIGWTDVSISLSGHIVDDLVWHFVDRWNYIFGQKYNTEDGRKKYQPITDGAHGQQAPASMTSSWAKREGGPENEDLMDKGQRKAQEFFGKVETRFRKHFPHHQEGAADGTYGVGRPAPDPLSGMSIQLCRSSSLWSSGLNTEHSIANAYIATIYDAQHFIYIENQFFITATDDKQAPVYNKIGAALVARIVRAHQHGEAFRVIVLMPAVPGFAGDLKGEGALGTRAIMEYQYFSISRGGHSIIQKLIQSGITNPDQYISFYNLRNYDRIKKQGSQGKSVAAAYMANGPNLQSIPWEGNPEEEIDAFVSEQLYIHTKLLIADDRRVIIGSANLNDRSQLGNHDSEIAVVIEDNNLVQSIMAGRQYTVTKFATSLRRFIFRKHLGLVPDQRVDVPDANSHPVTRGPNDYDWGSPADNLVADPLSAQFEQVWRGTARTNTEVFSKVFHNVPNDAVRTWQAYDEFFSRYFYYPDTPEASNPQGKVPYGHVCKSEFPGGVQEVKSWLSRVRGTLVEMPLQFLIDVDDIAKEGPSLNELTYVLYT
ncbi:hypothetical protein HDU93_008370 [Gonapodya sp. JEL0774]|nr:hypothetical protein HDU93_008370 [Gonapodya sp. JEL0774]